MVNFPQSVDDNTSLFLAVDNLKTTLTSAISDSTLVIPVVSTAGFPSTGFITIPSGTDITLSEKIRYTSITATSFIASERGVDATPASAHNASTDVLHTIVSDHHNSLKDAVIALENFVGVSGSTNFLPVDHHGNVTVTGVLTAVSGSYSQSLTVSGLPVSTGGGVRSLNNFSGVVTVTGTPGIVVSSVSNTISISFSDPLVFGDVTVDNLTVNNSGIFCGPALFKDDIDVPSGTITVGSTTIVSGSSPAYQITPLFASQDSEQYTLSLTYVDSNCETSVLTTDTDYLIIYTGDIGCGSQSIRVGMQLLYGATVYAKLDPTRISRIGTATDKSYLGAQCAGFAIVAGDGVSTVKFQHKTFGTVATQSGIAGAMAIAAVPLNNFVEDQDYFIVQNANSDSASLTNATDTDFQHIVSGTVNISSADTYIYLASCEGNMDVDVANQGWEVRSVVDGTVIGPSSMSHRCNTDGTGGDDYQSYTRAQTLSLGSGAHTVALQGKSIDASGGGNDRADFRRGRIILLKSSLFDTVQDNTDATGFSTSSTTFQSFISANYTPNTNEKIIILASAVEGVTNANETLTSAIRDNTNAINYRTDFGTKPNNIADGSTLASVKSTLGLHVADVLEGETTNWQWRIRTAGAGANNVIIGLDDAASVGQRSDFIIWSMTGPVPAPIEPNFTVIASGSVTSPCIQATDCMTISGSVVVTGTGFTDTITFWAPLTSGGAQHLNTIQIRNGLIGSWIQIP